MVAGGNTNYAYNFNFRWYKLELRYSYPAFWSRMIVLLCVLHQQASGLNVSLQGANHLVNEMLNKITAFLMKLRLWEQQIWSNNMTLFPILRTENLTDAKNTPKKFRFFHKNSAPVFKIYAHVWSHNQLIFSTINLALMLNVLEPNFKWRWRIFSVIRAWEIHFYTFDSLTCINSFFSVDKYQLLSVHARRMTSLFVAHMFVTSSRQDNEHSESSIGVPTSHIRPYVENLMS